MEQVIAEIRCQSHTDQNDDWIKHSITPADLRLRVLDNNLVTFDFMNGDDILATYRACWHGYLKFVSYFGEWLFADEPHAMAPSCVDFVNTIRFLAHDELVVSLSLGTQEPEFVFYAYRSDILGMLDSAARVVFKQPESGCYRDAAEDGETAGVASDPSLHEIFASMSQRGHTVH